MTRATERNLRPSMTKSYGGRTRDIHKGSRAAECCSSEKSAEELRSAIKALEAERTELTKKMIEKSALSTVGLERSPGNK